MIHTRVTELLERQGVHFELLPHSRPVFTVEAAAAERGVSAQAMVKCILLREKRGDRFVMACLPGDARLDPQAVREALPGGWRRLSFASAEEIVRMTAYPQGAVAPLDLSPEIPVIFDQRLAQFTQVNISSGDPLAGVELDPGDLIRITGARLAQISKDGAV